MCLPCLPDFDTRNIEVQIKKQLFSVSGYAEKFLQEFWGFFQKVIRLKAITATCSALAFQWEHVNRKGSREEAFASVGDFSGFWPFFLSQGPLLNLMLAVSANEIWISNQTFPELGSTEMGQVSDFRGLSVITSENISHYNLSGFCIVRWFFFPWTPHILGIDGPFLPLTCNFYYSF